MNFIQISRRKILAALAVASVLCGASLVFIYHWALSDLPSVHPNEMRIVHPTAQIRDRHGRLLYELLDPNYGKQLNLNLNSLPQACIQATLATEDSRFFHHPGIDPIAIIRALWQNVRGRQVISGGSTLTQQLARNLFLPPTERYEQTLRRKVREAWLAWMLGYDYTKNELLALYLNQTYYGHFAFGLEAAAQIFFAKPALQLSSAECALLAGLIQYPSGYDPLLDPDVAKRRQLTALRLMEEAGYIDQLERRRIAAEPLRYRSHLFDIKAPHFVMYIQDRLLDTYGIDAMRGGLLEAGGLQITTTLDLDLQRKAEEAIRHRLDRLNCRKPGHCDALTDPHRRVDNAAAIILDNKTGDILAMVGSPDYFDATIQGNVNATLTHRQPGSAIKPFTYAAALDPEWSRMRGQKPLTAASILADLPTTFYVEEKAEEDRASDRTSAFLASASVLASPYTPLNYDRVFHGPVSVRAALANSYNVPAVKVLDQIGVETLQQLAGLAGIRTFTNESGLALTLGGSEVSLLELTTAYGIFLDGQRLETRSILNIRGISTPFRAQEFGRYSTNCVNCRSQSARNRITTPFGIPPEFASADRSTTEAPGSTTENLRKQVITPETAYLVTDILSDPIARIPAFGENSVLALPFSAAVKTGTTTDWRDNWTIGYTPDYIVGVWVGNADNTPMLDVSGVDGAGPIWRDLMLAAHHQLTQKAPSDFKKPSGIVEQTICDGSGNLPSVHCPRLRKERFVAGTVPAKRDTQFQAIKIDIATGKRATANTPQERIAKRIYWMLSTEYHDWMIAHNIAIAPPPPPPIASADQTTKPSNQDIDKLVLATPISRTAYQIHPGLPTSRQRIQIGGFVRSEHPWRELRLIKDNQVILTERNSTKIDAWWTLEVGQHRFWLEGIEADNDREERVIRSQESFVVVEEFTSPTVASTDKN
ncbi:transglycosylase domain-containing protein [Chloroflexi bacterium TSY]|nr:transglycosylase domain-containing protein [Chloroflexi bacterium TSY]